MRPSTAPRSMTAERFSLDTNILVYTIDARDPTRQSMADALVKAAATKDCILTAQAVCELYSAATRRLRMPPADAAEVCRGYLNLFHVVSYDGPVVERALAEAVGGRLSFWDALLVGTAEAAGCAVGLSEDMADGARLGGTTIRHPFSGNALSAVARRLAGTRRR